MRRGAIGLQISLDVAGRHALVLGGGPVAEDKTLRLLDAEAWVTVITPAPGPGLRALAEEGRVFLKERPFEDEDADTADLVLVCEHDRELAERAHQAARRVEAGFWADDEPELSDMAMPALVRLGRARLAISTAGAAPALAARLRECLTRELGERFAAFVETLAEERERVLAEELDPERRRARLRALVDGFDLQLTVRYPGPPDGRTGN